MTGWLYRHTLQNLGENKEAVQNKKSQTWKDRNSKFHQQNKHNNKHPFNNESNQA